MSKIKKDKNSATISFTAKDLPSDFPKLKSDLLELIQQGTSNIELDFAKVKTLDMHTLVLLVSSKNSISAVNGSLNIVNCQDDVLNWIGALNLIDYLNVKIN